MDNKFINKPIYVRFDCWLCEINPRLSKRCSIAIHRTIHNSHSEYRMIREWARERKRIKCFNHIFFLVNDRDSIELDYLIEIWGGAELMVLFLGVFHVRLLLSLLLFIIIKYFFTGLLVYVGWAFFGSSDV